MPDTNPAERRDQCLLHSDRLKNIDTNVKELTKEFRAFISTEGPFIAVRDRVSVLETKTERLVAKVTGIVVSIMGIAWFVITKYLTGGGNG